MSVAFAAEISGNHLGDKLRALQLIDLAAGAGADMVKFQTFDPDRLVGDHAYTLPDGPWKGQRLLQLYKDAWTPKTWHPHLFERARKRGLTPFSSPFSPEDVDYLEGLNCPMYKIASCEITDLELIRYVAQTGKPIVISTGMSTLREIELAVDEAIEGGAKTVTLTKCVSGYPAPAEEANLATIRDMIDYFTEARAGLSDHSLGVAVPVAAIALGATLIEKHLTLARADGGPDAGFSAEPQEFAQMVDLGRLAAQAVGSIHYGPVPSEQPQLILRRALWVVAPVRRGEIFTSKNLRPARPGLGRLLMPAESFHGRRAAEDIAAGTLFEEAMLA